MQIVDGLPVTGPMGRSFLAGGEGGRLGEQVVAELVVAPRLRPWCNCGCLSGIWGYSNKGPPNEGFSFERLSCHFWADWEAERLDRSNRASYASDMVLSRFQQFRLSNWRAPIALSGLSALVAGVSAGACGAPAVDDHGGTGTTSSSSTTDGTTGSESSSSTTGVTSSTSEETGISDLTTGVMETTAETTDGPMGVDGDFCADFEIEYLPQTPTVYILVDMSTSMFEQMFWDPMKQGVLEVVEQLQADVRFGFGSYTGTNATCMGLTPGAEIARDNFAAIKAAYDGLAHPGTKTETPTPLAIRQVSDILVKDMEVDAGEKYILLVSDGQPDFCDDPDPACSTDATVASLQQAHKAGVTTLVFGLENDSVDPLLFNYYAQAGQGQMPSFDKGLNVAAYNGTIESQCKNVNPLWSELRELNGNAPDPATCATLPPEGEPSCFLPAGHYDATGGTAEAFLNSDPAALAEQILTQVQELKSCTIDVNFEVSEGSEMLGEIYVGDLENQIPASDWTMPTASSIQLLGDSCNLWLLESTKDFFAGFPCEVITPIDIIR